MILRLDASLVDEREVGGKAAGLSRLMSIPLPVPPSMLVPVEARGELDDPEAIVAALGEPLAVRSSAVGEDAAERSAAGQYESLMGVRLEGLVDAVRRVHASGASQRVIAYGGSGAMAVLIQPQIAATRAGVAFSRHPAGDPGSYVECVFGHGERLVSGLADPDRYRIAPDGEVQARVARRQGPTATIRTLRDDEARVIADAAGRAQTAFGRPVDVEFCFDLEASLVILQARAITALDQQT